MFSCSAAQSRVIGSGFTRVTAMLSHLTLFQVSLGIGLRSISISSTFFHKRSEINNKYV